MRSRLFPMLAVPVVLSALSGCAFTQWTDHAFLGSPQDPPTHANREWAAAAILPLAIAGDLITAPIQGVVLLILGDYGIYADRNYPAGYPVQDERVSLHPDAALRLAGIGTGANAPAADRLVREVESRLSSVRGDLAPGVAWGLDANGGVVELPLTADQRETLLARAASGGHPVRIARN